MLELSFSFPLLSSFALLQRKPTTSISLVQVGHCFPRSLHTRDARDNNLESTLVVTATATPPPQPCRPKISFHSAFPPSSSLPRSLYELSAPKLWPARKPVNCRQRCRESTGGRVPVTFAGLFRGESRADFRLPASVRTSFFAPGENYLGLRSSGSSSCGHQFARSPPLEIIVSTMFYS